ncbi:MAG: transposase [Flavobacteriales bacterium]|nr:transposase [Flavobacteriales bacterium]
MADRSGGIAHVVQRRAQRRWITRAYIQPGKPWQNSFAESFVGTFRREVLNAEVFFSLNEARFFFQTSGYTWTTHNVHTANTTTDHLQWHSTTRQDNHCVTTNWSE